MKQFLISCIFSLVLLGSGPYAVTPAKADYTTTVNPSVHWGTWQGWGCSLAWWANAFGGNTNMADAAFTLKNPVSFTSNTGPYPLPGLGFNVLRYNIGGTSDTPIFVNGKTYSPNNPRRLPAFKSIQTYWLDWGSSDPKSSSWDWSRDSNQRAMMQLAKERGVNTFQMFSDSPPWWMCDNLSTTGNQSGASDNLETWNYDQFALYMATVARYAKDHWGIMFESVEPFNEPNANWWRYPGGQEGCHFDVATQNAVILDLRTDLDKQGLNNIPIATSDENTYDGELNTWSHLTPVAQSDCGQIDTHGYQGKGGRRDLLYTAAKSADKALWNSEYGEGDGSGMSLASNLTRDLRSLHPTVWCYWQPFDSGGWGLVQANPGDNWIGPANPKWYVMAQYSRHIRPGMTIIDGGEDNTVAAYDPKAKKLVLVTVCHGTEQWITYDLSKFRSVGGPVARWETDTAGGDKYAEHNDTTLTGKSFRVWFGANTVQTFEIQNVRL